MGGEKLLVLLSVGWLLGSPPRGRGKEVKDLREAIQLRITPAWAGKRPDCPAGHRPDRDHPRVGGEKCDLLSDLLK